MRHEPTGVMLRVKFRRALVAALLMLAAALPSTAAAQSPAQGPGGPILVVAGNSFGSYYAEILRAEGLNEFAVGGLGDLNPQTLGAYQVVLLGEAQLTDAQASALDGWVQAGGNLIAMRPDARLAPLLGLGSDTGNLVDGYVGVATGSGPGAGITGETMQYHGAADRWSGGGATTVATLYSSATTATSSPAVTLRSVGSSGGQAAAFAYDLARSVVWTRQGNPAWAGDERDGVTPLRSDDLFFGGASAPDWVNLDKVHIPQADEQQRLLANLITQMNLDRTPLPRFWYLPRGGNAAVVMTGDDHSNGGTPGQFDTFKQQSPPGCSVADWQCIRATSYIYPGTISNALAAAYQADGFEIALHLWTGCNNFTPQSLTDNWNDQSASFSSMYPNVAPPRTNRTHCIVWSDWASEATVERTKGVRLDTNYYYWPGTWMLNRPGMFTGSGMPMRFADFDGSLIDVYQATTQITDEWGPTGGDVGVANHIAQLLNRALGPEGYYGAFTANMHTDYSSHAGADAIVAAAKSRGVPVISAVQLLDWLDGRNGSSFQGVSYSDGQLRFGVTGGARGLEAMVPASSATGGLTSLTRDGAPVSFAARRVKGIDYLVFEAAPGSYVAAYAGGGTPPAAGGGFNPLPVPPIGKGGALGSNDQSAPRAKVTKRRVRVRRDGTVRLRVRCVSTAVDCLTDVRLRRHGSTLAKRTLTLQDGKTTKVKLRLRRRARSLLAESGSLKVKAVLRVTHGERAPVVSKKRIELLAPGW
jgi:hypothetical protein